MILFEYYCFPCSFEKLITWYHHINKNLVFSETDELINIILKIRNRRGYKWHDISSTLSVVKLQFHCLNGKEPRRFVIIREKLF